ncbi:putative Inosine-5'-monophosphate dehydrogenase 1b-like 14 [Homarus americanus]|uniref:Putative Inosine-5'-monophosphate dehydrogenase 1b-like 14 n=1 Tax=Homarus americanus TaxID=6706 RepID=A0A8J5MN14_HOMAM|nr:putative Inosine-5'-monophosphate dehydrogenase 1b-like 14 [Homarus americanus]
MFIKDDSRTKKAKTTQIFADAMLEATDEVRARAGKPDTIRRDIRRVRRGCRPKEPSSLAELHLDEEWTETGGNNPRPFLIHDSGADTNDRVIIFATEASLRLLSRSSQWHMDGTFAMSPKIFKQVYVIRVLLALLPGKTQSIYEELLQAVITQCEHLGCYPDPSTIITDFEQTTIKAVSSVFGEHTTVQGCFYHLTQSTWRKIQDLGLVPLYKSNENVKKFCGMLDGLALLPLDDVIAGMEYLKENTPDGLKELVDYFDATYTSSNPPANPNNPLPPVRLRHRPPVFPPAVWNVFESTITRGDRTNNICEGWNNSFRPLIGHQHPSIWTVIEAFRNDQALAATTMLQDQIGERPQKRVRRAQKTFEERLIYKTGILSTFGIRGWDFVRWDFVHWDFVL